MSVKVINGKRLKALRESRRITQHDLASALRRRGFGTTQTTVSRWEDGQSPNSAVLPVLASELGVSLDELYADAEEEEPSDMAADLFRQAVAAAVTEELRRREREARRVGVAA